jgi:flagellar hook assembly protein FlgD
VLVGGSELRLDNPLAFPNPFDDDLGTFFSFQLVSGADADVQIRVFTTSGKLIHEWEGRGLAPGYHQVPWNGYDAERTKIANGVYVYRIVATNGQDDAVFEGRLVKLRKPRRGDSNAP